MTGLAELVAVGNEAADLARDMVRSHGVGAIAEKGDRDMVSDLDIEVERRVRALLKERTRHIGFLGEEEGRDDSTTDTVWVLDPIDGTANLIHGLPLCGTSLALIRDGIPVVGVIDLPFLSSRYWAFAGGGAHRNGSSIRASLTGDLSDAIVSIGDYAVGEDSTRKNVTRLAVTAQLSERVQRVRMFGSAAIDLAWVAAGQLDASVMLSNHPWDTAAGVVIAREAGAQVVDADGSIHTMSSGATVACSPALLEGLLGLITASRHRVQPGPD